MNKLRIKLGMMIIRIGKWIQPDYWVCFNCGHIEYKEREIMCWECGIGEMIYKGKTNA